MRWIKFLNRTDLGIFTWYGKDRSVQFGGYFEKTAVSDAWLHPLLYLTGVIEFLVFIPLFLALWGIHKDGVLYRKHLERGMFWGGIHFYRIFIL